MPRQCGILLHPSSLPSDFGIGDFGPSAYQFVDFLERAGQTIWQVLPMGPTGYGDSPYQCFSAFAGNPMFISPERLVEAGWLASTALTGRPEFPIDKVDYEGVGRFRLELLEQAADGFDRQATLEQRREFEEFEATEKDWLDDFALFMAVKDAHGSTSWTSWESDIAQRKPDAVKKWRQRCSEPIRRHRLWQFFFQRQWNQLRGHCHERGIRIIGDMPIYVAHDSADVWSRPELFRLTPSGVPEVVAGVPPDYFSATGQLWGNPIYRWDEMAKEDFAWWIHRFRSTLEQVDQVRLDHFRGFEAYWEVPATDSTAIWGQWVAGPGAKLFESIRRQLGTLPIIAENLGVITPEVEDLRQQFDFPGMAILQFAFGDDARAREFKPHNYVPNLVAYTGTHDNDTIVGWWNSGSGGDSTRTAEGVRRERDLADRYLDIGQRPVHLAFVHALLASVAEQVVIPVQDLLGLGNEARMNLPGRAIGNWRWRLTPGMLENGLADMLRQWTELFERYPRARAESTSDRGTTPEVC